MKPGYLPGSEIAHSHVQWFPCRLLFPRLLLPLGGGLGCSLTFSDPLGGRLSFFCPNALIPPKELRERIAAIRTTTNNCLKYFITTCRLRVCCNLTLEERR